MGGYHLQQQSMVELDKFKAFHVTTSPTIVNQSFPLDENAKTYIGAINKCIGKIRCDITIAFGRNIKRWAFIDILGGGKDKVLGYKWTTIKHNWIFQFNTRYNSTHLKEVTSIVVLRVSTSSHYLQPKIEIDHHERINICHNVKSSHQ